MPDSGFIFSGLLDLYSLSLSVGFVLSDTALFDAYMFLSLVHTMPIFLHLVVFGFFLSFFFYLAPSLLPAPASVSLSFSSVS